MQGRAAACSGLGSACDPEDPSSIPNGAVCCCLTLLSFNTDIICTELCFLTLY